MHYERTIKNDLSFAGEKLSRGRHKIHPYPAMLHPLLVDTMINEYAKPTNIIFDPFCGSGVVLLQASISNHKSIGYDINPLALLIAKVKTRKYNIKILLEEFDAIKNRIEKAQRKDIPTINNIEYWYSKTVDDLGKVRYILKNNEYKYKDFFVCIFAFVCRNQSLTRNGEFKRYRIEKEKITDKSDVLDKFSIIHKK